MKPGPNSPAPGSPTQRRGGHYEGLACRHLQRAGLILLQRNFRCKCGEIDLVMREGGTLVFVEVRFRRGGGHGSAVESVNRRKQMKLLRTAQLYLQMKGLGERMPCRFDVVGIDVGAGGESYRWIRGAFS